MRLTLRARLLVVPAVVVAGAVALATLLEHGAQRRWLIARESDQLLRVTREAARTAAAADGSWQAFADSLDARFALRATMMAADGTVLADSRAQAATMENHAAREEMRAALQGRPGLSVRRSATVGVEFLYCAVPVSPPRERAAVLRLAEPLVVVSRLGDALTRVSTTAAALALLASILVLAGVSARFA
ncbi:MAG TPA: hypothetical protein VN896_00145, partial [Methylomirabilota bacterium]|nr:hypothetical protein [Methylomirabilota bacterium]